MATLRADPKSYRKFSKILRLLITDSAVTGTLFILSCSAGLSAVIFFLTWLIYRDRYGIGLLEYIRFVF